MKNFIFYFLVLCTALMLFSSCTPQLNIQTQYLSQEYLASYHVDTPDPRLYYPIIGQRLVIEWSFNLSCIENQKLFLYLKVRFRNQEEQEINIPVNSNKGTYLYEVVNEAYHQSGGILTYFAEIRNGNCEVLATWQHPLWTELIKFNFSNSKLKDPH